MKPQWYLDIRVAQDVSERGPSGSAIAAMAMFLRTVHRFARAAEFSFAAAFPAMRVGTYAHPGTVLRIFAEQRDQCDRIADAIEASELTRGAAMVSRVRPVPQGVQESVSYTRYRVASRKSAGQVSGEGRETPGRMNGFERRNARLKHGEALPYLKTHSSTTGQSFSLRFRPQQFAAEPTADCLPDSYGLSTVQRPFALPLLPLAPAPWERLRAEAREVA